MNCIKPIAVTLLVSLLQISEIRSQHATTLQLPATEEHLVTGEHALKHNRLSLLMYHNYINIETLEGSHLIIIPALGFDYEFWFSENWGCGLHNDVVITHKIAHNMLSDRSYPFLTTLDGLWKPYKGLVFLLGPGLEIEHSEHLFFVRGGIEYEIEIGSHWDVCPTIFYDSRKSAFNTCSIGMGLGKRF
ncbi:MAG: hypothetical protein LPJ89_07425 [Hymenobacteraceae bacterium]|nr:hypothetical protein [Hymenobacteraceae bacterium]MDX5394577.1 hypothetical protein [Hymenobacteraceae bacterium]MDX5443596.1 hypothetical protein [Hymenobacteraceae bacterium]MDX5510603.1 hypothetical protein [Hymenobacteraceae bacterium]